MKPITFLGDSRRALRGFPDEARRTAGFQLETVQYGGVPDDWRSMPSIGPGAAEIRVRESGGAFRVIYVAKFQEAVYVLHAFQKTTRRTARRDLELARTRYREMTRDRR
jgi:phage-related protein